MERVRVKGGCVVYFGNFFFLDVIECGFEVFGKDFVGVVEGFVELIYYVVDCFQFFFYCNMIIYFFILEVLVVVVFYIKVKQGGGLVIQDIFYKEFCD